METSNKIRSLFLFLAVVFLSTIAVSATMTESILKVPLFEIGKLWLSAIDQTVSKFYNHVTSTPDMTSPYTYIVFSCLTIFLYYGYVLFFRPLNRVRKLGDIGYIPTGSLSVKETANIVQKQRKSGNVPPVYPNGWFALMESFTLHAGQALTISAIGQNFAVFRDTTEKEEVHVLDAYCPHMGANLAAGGRVKGNCIECPFHAWHFRGDDGKCVSIPYTDKIPEKAKVKSWPVTEANGWIFVWHHADDIDPTWEVEIVPEIASGQWVYRGRTEHHINAHIEEIPENASDVVHLDQVHGPVMFAGIDLRTMWSKWWSFSQHNWTAAWEACPEPNSHISQMKLTHKMSVFGLNIPIINLDIFAKQIGPGLVYLHFSSFFGRGMYIQTVTPQEPLVQKVVHNIYVSSWMPRFIAKFFMLGEALQVERDIMIWNNKQYEAKPLFVKSKEDSLISRHRRWYSQFYSENSPRLFRKDDLEF